MTKQRSFKRSLAKSILSVTLCAGMLVGSTYAWFSDTATAGETTITAGNLQVGVYDGDGTAKLEKLFDYDSLGTTEEEFEWEPGKMLESKEFTIKNEGSLDLSYVLSLNMVPKSESSLDLSEVIQVKVLDTKAAGVSAPSNGDTTTLTQRRDYWNKITGDAEVTAGELKAGATSNKLKVVLFWDPTERTDSYAEGNIDNKYNIESGSKLQADFSIEVFATQLASESDSFGKNYDAGAAQNLKVAAAVESGLAALPSEIVNAISALNLEEFDAEDAITVEKVTYDENGVGSATMKFGNQFKTVASNEAAEAKAMGAAFVTCADQISEILFSQKENISKIEIEGNQGNKTVDFSDPTISSSDKLGEKLTEALIGAVAKSGLGDDGKVVTLTVNVTTKSGDVAPYELNFDFNNTNVLDEDSLINYALAIFEAISSSHSDWQLNISI